MKLTNQLFCYWLQGYFEISEHPLLTKEIVQDIEKELTKISEPLGVFTLWLKKTIEAMAFNHYNSNLMQLLMPTIQKELNSIFIHAIDNSYETSHSHDYLLSIHNGSQEEN